MRLCGSAKLARSIVQLSSYTHPPKKNQNSPNSELLPLLKPQRIQTNKENPPWNQRDWLFECLLSAAPPPPDWDSRKRRRDLQPCPKCFCCLQNCPLRDVNCHFIYLFQFLHWGHACCCLNWKGPSYFQFLKVNSVTFARNYSNAPSIPGECTRVSHLFGLEATAEKNEITWRGFQSRQNPPAFWGCSRPASQLRGAYSRRCCMTALSFLPASSNPVAALSVGDSHGLWVRLSGRRGKPGSERKMGGYTGTGKANGALVRC